MVYQTKWINIKIIYILIHGYIKKKLKNIYILLELYFCDYKRDVTLLKRKSAKKPVYRRRKKELPIFDIAFKEEIFSLPECDDMTPFKYFKIFWDDSVYQNLLEQTIVFS